MGLPQLRYELDESPALLDRQMVGAPISLEAQTSVFGPLGPDAWGYLWTAQSSPAVCEHIVLYPIEDMMEFASYVLPLSQGGVILASVELGALPLPQWDLD